MLRRKLLGLLCRTFGHRRSGRRAYVDPNVRRWRSTCRRCRAPMERDAVNGWRILEK